MSKSSDEQVFLTPDQAIAMLPDGDSIHTFRSSAGCLIGADWSRDRLIDEIRKASRRELGGEQCCAVNHGLVLNDGQGPLFVECREGTDYAAIASETTNSTR